MRVKPPGGFRAVHLPNKEFERLYKQLKGLGFKVETQLVIDEDEKVITVLLTAEKSIQERGYRAEIVVSYESPCETAYVEVFVTDKEGNKVGEVKENVDIKALVRRVQYLESKCNEIIKEDRKRKEQMRHEVKEVSKYFKELGFEIKPTTYPYYVSGIRRVGKLVIYVGYDAEMKPYGISVEAPKHDLTLDELRLIVRRLLGGEGEVLLTKSS